MFSIRPAEVVGRDFIRLTGLIAAVVLVLAAFRLLVLVIIDPTRSLLEQLPKTRTPPGTPDDAVHSGLLVIDTFRENRYRLNLPLNQILSDLDAVRLWRDANPE